MSEKKEIIPFDSMRICPVCSKEFYTPDPEKWVYKDWNTCKKQNRIYFCRYKCFMAYEKGETQLNGRGMRLSMKKEKIWQALDDGLTVKEIAVLLDIPPKQVSYYKAKWAPNG